MSKPESKSTSHQIILLNREAHVRYSCETLMELKKYKDASLIKVSPFLESIYPQLLIRQSESKALRYNRMENPFPGLSGTYDFSFQWVEIHDGNYILWNIYDLSDLYKSIKIAQQKRNEQAILTEKLARIKKADFKNWSTPKK